MDLAEKKCEACSESQAAMSHEKAEEMLTQIPGWELKDNVIERTFKFPNFVEAMQFANRITLLAEQENHHPDLHISWGKVRVELTTHKVNGLSDNDFILAAKISAIINNASAG